MCCMNLEVVLGRVQGPSVFRGRRLLSSKPARVYAPQRRLLPCPLSSAGVPGDTMSQSYCSLHSMQRLLHTANVSCDCTCCIFALLVENKQMQTHTVSHVSIRGKQAYGGIAVRTTYL